MYPRFAILITLLFIRVLISPIWYSYNVNHLSHPDKAFEQVRLHKRRSSYTDDAVASEETVFENAQEEQRTTFGLLRIIKRWFSVDGTDTILPSYHYTYFLSPLFLRNRVLRI